MTADQTLLDALRRLDPGRPAEVSELERRPDSADAGPWDRLPELEALLRSGSRFRILLHGAVGVGKTTELLRWSRALGARAAFVRDPKRNDLPNHDGVLLIDGLDTRPADFARNFGPGSWLVEPHVPSFVATVPASFGRSSPADRDPAFTAVWHLPPFSVRTRDGGPAAAGAVALEALLMRRLGSANDAFEDAQSVLLRSALLSGGVPRDAIRILRGAILAGLSRGKVGRDDVLRGSRELRQDLEQALGLDDLRALADVAKTNRYFGDGRLVLAGAVLAYEDATGRFWLPHPLLEDAIREAGGPVVIRPGGGSGT